LNPSTYGNSVTFTAAVTPSAATGTVTFKNGNVVMGTGTISGGEATYTTSALPGGTDSIKAVYGGDSNYNTSTSSVLTQTVNTASSSVAVSSSTNPSIYDTTVTFTATVTPSTATGNVIFRNGGTEIGTGTISNGSATFSTSNLVVGTHSITAVYNGDNNYSTSTSSILDQVNMANTSMTLASSANPSISGNSVTFTAAVTPTNATGTVTFNNGSTHMGTGSFLNGLATYTTSALSAGGHSITAVYVGSPDFNGSTSTALTQTVLLPTTVTVSSSANPSIFGSSVTFTATVSAGAATGTVTIDDGGSPIGTGTISGGTGIYTYTTSSLTGGTHSITAVYSGDSNYAGSTSPTLTQTISKANTAVALASSTNPSAYGSSVTLTATVSPATATGIVTFADGSTTLGTGTIGSGTATFTTSALGGGSHSITATYGGDGNYATSVSSTLTQTVNKVNTAVSLESSANPSTYASSIMLTATVSPTTATGAITFNDGGSPIGTATISDGSASYATSTLTAGSHSITASYGGDANDNASTSSVLTEVVTKANTTTTLSSSANPSAYGSPVTFIAMVAPTIATGTVTFTDGSATIGTATINSGVATYSTSALSAGSHSITAAYGGDSSDNSSTSSVLTQAIQSSAGFVATSGQMSASRYGQTATQLTTGQILIAGGMSSSGVVSSADLYALASQSFTPGNAMNVARWLHTATLLNDGTVLIAGGSDLANEETLDTAEIYSPTAGTFTPLSATLNTARVGHTATLLNNGQVLIVGGYDPATGLIADAELYDPPTQTFIDLGDTNAPRYEHTATMLPNGQVLIAGGDIDPTPSGALNTAEIFDLPSQTFTPVPVPMTTQREGHAAVVLNNGQVLITGGDNPPTGSLNSAEIYDPPSNTFTAVTSAMAVPRISHVMTLLNCGKVLIAGGATDSGGNSTALNSAEVYDPASQTFALVGDMNSVRDHQTASLLNDGTVLEAGGTDGTNIFNTADIYTLSQLNGLTSIAITPATPSIGVGSQQLFTAVGTFSNGNTQTLSSVLWSSSSVASAPISGDATNPGVAATLAQGTTTITASAAGISGSATLTVIAPTLMSITLSPQSATIPLGATQQFTATGVYTDGSTQDLTATATWSSSATVVAAINGSGVAAGLFQGTATIQVNSGSVSASTALSVASPGLVSIAVTPTTATIALGGNQQYQAVGTYSDGSTQNVTSLVGWSSTATTVATVNGAGQASGVSQGTATLTATFESIAVPVSLTVGPPSLVSLSIAPDAASLSTGATQQLTATGTYTDGSTQNLTATSTWVSSNSSVIGVNSAGLATAATTGNATITATSGSTSATAALIVTSGTTQASLNTSRYLHSSILLNNGQILVAGGINCPSAGSCTYLNSAELYNPATSAFANTGTMATARSAPAVLLNNGNVLVAGGYTCDGSGNCSSLVSAEIYNLTAGTFSSAGSMNVARSGQTMTVLSNGTVLIAGGETCTSATSCSAVQSAEIYDPIAGTFTFTSNNMSAVRFGASAVLLNSGSVLIAGGFDGTNLPAAAEIYSPSNREFTGSGPNLNVPRYNASATLLNNGQVLVSGGSTCSLPGCPTNAAEIFDPVANTFTLVSGGMNVPRFDHSATLTTNGQVVIAGGFSSCTSSCTSEASTEFFDPIASTFTSGQSVATALAGHTGTLLANGNVLLIGGINAGVTLGSDEWYQPTSFTPTNLVSIAVAPASSFLMPGQTQQFVATGTFNDGSTQTLQSVIWSSSNSSAAVISNSTGSAGIVNAQAQGTTTLTATAGDIGGFASLNVAGLVSLTITPANPSITIGSGQQLTATGTFSDGSQQNVTSSLTWSSSNNSSVLIGSTSGFQGYAAGVTSGTATITGTLGSVSASTSVTVQSSPTTSAPNIISVSPSSGAGGTQVTITGSGFGAQGTGTVWLGSTYATVVSWTNTQIVATVAAISQSGTTQVQQNGLSSNAVQFNVNTAAISNVSPASGVPGTQVSITGSGFGATQGSGQVWLGTANGVVQSWSDTQVVAVVATGSTSGNALILQNGVMSNAVPFAVNSLNIASVTPTSGGPGTSVTITGTGFGSTQGSGQVWQGGVNGGVTSWSNTQVVAVVAASAVTGVVRIEQNGILSNAISFTVPTSGGNALTLIPNMLNLVIGQTQTIQALNASSQPVTGLTWTSSNPQVVSLSTDDPPVLTALTVGHVTITTGTASADVTVYSATLPTGTVIWSNPGDGSGVVSIVPAVPSATGVADVFAFQADGTVLAITSSGATAWTANLNGAVYYQTVPDFQGGLVVPTAYYRPQAGQYVASSIMKLDGITGQPNPAYSVNPATDAMSVPPLVHTDGTIFTLDYNNYTQACCNSSGNYYYMGAVSVIGINPKTGTQKFSVALDSSTSNSSFSCTGCGELPGVSTFSSAPTVVAGPIIAGDGFAYVAYSYQVQAMTDQETWVPVCDGDPCQVAGSTGSDTLLHLMILKVGSDGVSNKIDVKDWESKQVSQWSEGYTLDPDSTCCYESSSSTSGAIPHLEVSSLITNADQGALFAWEADTGQYCAASAGGACNLQVPAATTFGIATTTGGVASVSTTNVSGETAPINPVLQAQDGTFVGTVDTTAGGNMIAFDGRGNLIWSVPNDYPQIATADGGVIGASGITYDSQGNATGQLPPLPTYSWKGAYQYGSVDATASPLTVLATSFAAVPNGNLTGVSPTYVVHHTIGVFWCGNTFSGTCQNQNPPVLDYNNKVMLDLGFYYDLTPILGNSNGVPTPKPYDFTGRRQWDGVIISQAFSALRAAFAQFPALVVQLSSTSYTPAPWTQAIFGAKQSSATINQDYTVYIGSNVFSGLSGTTNFSDQSFVYYGSLLDGAAQDLNIGFSQLPFASPLNGMTPAQAVAWQNLLAGTGIGIGNIAAHELGHQFELPFIDCNKSGSLPCPGGVSPNLYYEYYQEGLPDFSDIGSPLQWTTNSISCINQQLLTKNTICSNQ
jgi:uncharacterized protein YjdB